MPFLLEGKEDPDRSSLLFIESEGTDSMKALSAESASKIQMLSFADGMRLLENPYLFDSLGYFKKSPVL